MALVVQKFGGTSVANAQRLMAAARRAIRTQQAGNQVVVVVSARGDTTDDLIEMAREVTERPPAREMDMLLSTGEQISIALMAMAIHELGSSAVSFTGAQVGIVTDSTHTKARIKSIDTARLRAALDAGQIVIVAGFQGIDDHLNITTLGRGGSDTTAVALAAVLKHDATGKAAGEAVECEIYTDVDGVYTTDPRLVPEARKMDALSYDEMLELASAGAGVMHSRSIEFAKKFDVPLMVRSSFSDAEGTWIVPEAEWMRDIAVCGAAVVRDEARVLLGGVPDRPGVSHRVFEAVAGKLVAVDMIAQSVGADGRAALGFTVARADLPAVRAVLAPLAAEMGATLTAEEDVSKVSVVGTGMRTHIGIAERAFAALAAEGVNVKMVTTGDIKISVLVEKADAIRSLRALHQAFRLHEARPGAGGGSAPSDFKPRARPALESTTRRDLMLRLQNLAGMEDTVVSGVVQATDQGRVTVTGLPDTPGQGSRVFQAVAGANIVVDMIVQNTTPDGQAELSFSVPRGELTRALIRTQDAVRASGTGARTVGDADIAVLYVLGVGVRTHTGVARLMFGALAERGINILMINTSEVVVGVAVERCRGDEALACLRGAFGVE